MKPFPRNRPPAPATPHYAIHLAVRSRNTTTSFTRQFLRVRTSGQLEKVTESGNEYQRLNRLKCILCAFSIFDSLRLPTETNLPVYGINELDTLCSHYGLPKTNESGQELSPLVEPDGTKDEWVTFKQVMRNNFSTCTLQTMAQKILPSAEMKE